MDVNIELLNYIHQNAKMGADAVNTLLSHGLDPQTAEHLQKQLADYQTICQQAGDRLREWKHEEKDPPAVEKIISYLSINAKTMLDPSPAHIAEMMMQGSVMGIIDITKKRKKCAAAEQPLIDLANALLKLEEDSFNQWKLYLGMTA